MTLDEIQSRHQDKNTQITLACARIIELEHELRELRNFVRAEADSDWFPPWAQAERRDS